MTSSNGNIFRVTGTLRWSPLKGQWRGVLMFSLICAWTNGWANNQDGGDLRRHRWLWRHGNGKNFANWKHSSCRRLDLINCMLNPVVQNRLLYTAPRCLLHGNHTVCMYTLSEYNLSVCIYVVSLYCWNTKFRNKDRTLLYDWNEWCDYVVVTQEASHILPVSWMSNHHKNAGCNYSSMSWL